MLPEGFGLSGIVSILFTGIVGTTSLRHSWCHRFIFTILSEDNGNFISGDEEIHIFQTCQKIPSDLQLLFFHLLSSLAETFVCEGCNCFLMCLLAKFCTATPPKNIQATATSTLV
jgi:hypothetical protein